MSPQHFNWFHLRSLDFLCFSNSLTALFHLLIYIIYFLKKRRRYIPALYTYKDLNYVINSLSFFLKLYYYFYYYHCYYSDSRKNVKENCTMLCMLHVPSLVNCPELLKFVSPRFQHISSMKIVRDATPNQYMVIIKFKTPVSKQFWFIIYNDHFFGI